MKQLTPEKLESMLRDLPNTVDAQFSDVKAGSHLKARIDRACISPDTAPVRFSLPRWVPAACCMAAVALILVLSPLALKQPGELITAGPLGGDVTAAPAAASNLHAGLGDSDVHIVATRGAPGFRSIWAESRNGSFPLIGVNGRYYRMLTSPLDVDSRLFGRSLGTIAEFTTEPSLSGTDVLLSNAVTFGQPVYAISGMGDTLVTAEVDGTMRLFQRVSFNGNALRGSETLADTLQVSGHVIAMELSGVGTITDPALCEELLATLLNCASYESSGSINPKQSLLIELDSNLVLQLAVRSDRLAACGTWSCPEFFEAFETACGK